MTVGELKEQIKFWEKQQCIGNSSEVIIGKHGTSGLIDGPLVQKKVTDSDIQVLTENGCTAFTIVYQ
tara:strand:- start:20 stop:220 length:201 start_codon:yes stop_codon:yes gene_type:complete